MSNRLAELLKLASNDSGEAKSAVEDDGVMTYTNNGRTFQFGDLVVAEVCFAPDCNRVGRLMQVRVGRGAFGSDIYLIRDHSGDLRSFHNVRLRHANDDAFVQAFYLNNGMQPPRVYPESEYEQDEPDQEYRIGVEYPERGFLIQDPKQPHDAQQSFAMMVTHGS